MAWSGGSYTKGNNGTGGWVGDASLGIGIEAGRHDTQDNDFATGINQCLNKDGSNAATGNLNLGGFLPTNIGAGTAAAPAICAGNDVNTGIFSPAADNIGIATNGVEKVRVDPNGAVTHTSTAAVGDVSLTKYESGTQGHVVIFSKSKSATVGTNTIVASGDALGEMYFRGANGTSFTNAAAIVCRVDGTPGASADMPGRLEFYTTPDGSGTLAERMRIDNAGNVGIATAPSSDTRLLINGSATATHYPLVCRDGSNVVCFWVRNDGYINTGLNTNSPYNNTTGAGANLHVAGDGILYRSTSSLKYKTDIADYSNGLAAVNSLRPVFYKDKKNPVQQFAGLIAEEVHEAGLREFVSYNADNEPDALHYGNMVALAFKAIQELNAKVEALEARVAELEAA